MKKLIKLSGLIFYILFTFSAFSQTMLRSDLPCREWLEGRKEKTSVALEHFFIGWINGYAHGSNFDIWQKPDDLSFEQVSWFIDNYCRKNPEKQAFLGILELIRERKNQ